ncbi:MAG: hypothetical protein JJ974_05235 [Phycisphaerales bacterium]|nr:hypothetical protein [Phycisphaerales bacterium]
MSRVLCHVLCALVLFSVLGGMVIDDDDFARSLERLVPSDPRRYLELGEESLLLHSSSERGRIGVELLVRAVILGVEHDQPMVASSACIALADLAEDARDQRWLWDLALLIDPDREAEWVEFHQRIGASQIDREAARCMHAIRFHQHPLGEDLFRQIEVREQILRAGERVGIERSQLVRLIERVIQQGLSDSCRGRLYIAERGSPGRRLVCPDHLRGLGLLSNDEDLRMYLRVEMELGGIEAGSWDGAVSMSRDAAVKVPRVSDLAARMGVRSDEVFYRDGRWVSTP